MGLRAWVASSLLIAAQLCAVAIAGCGGASDPPSPADAHAQHILDEGGIRGTAPEIEVPPGLPPKKLVVKDLHKGTGAVARRGDNVRIQYYGIVWGNDAEHANSWHYEHIPVVKLGERRLLRGLNLAIPGMREGGSREVIVPYTLIYYPHEEGRPLGPLDALIYKVYLVKVFKR